MNQPPLPIGVSSFRELREGGYYYTDKTMMIGDFLERGAKVTLITRPRRFGKTLNMDMIREFLDIEKESGNLFSGLSIMNTPVKEELNSRPVLFFSFRDSKGDSAYIINLMKKELYREFRRFDCAAGALSGMDLQEYEAIMSCLLSGDENTRPVNTAIAYLCRLVAARYGRNAVVLIDEYDTPMNAAYASGCYDELRPFFAALYGSALKDNPHLDRALLTGIQRIAKENIFSGLNNLEVCTVNDKFYSECFGFNEAETTALLETYGLKLTPEVKAMYDGYRFGSREVYNPWSLLNYVKSGELMPYWLNTASNDLIRTGMEQASAGFSRDFDALILSGSVDVAADLTTSFFEMGRDETLWGLFINAGYVTILQTIDSMDGLYRIAIPNGEVRQEFKALVERHTRLNGGDLKKMFDCLVRRRDIEGFLQIYRRIVLTATSYYDNKENAYHMLMLGMCVYLNGDYEITSNLEMGTGRSDIRLKARRQGLPHILMEFKQGTDLPQLSQKALEQIKEKQYASGLSGEVLLMGIAHEIKTCEIASEIVIR